jgi:hypothetical protein
LQNWHDLDLPFITARLRVFGVDILCRMDQSGFNIFEIVRFFSNILDKVDFDMDPSPELHNRLRDLTVKQAS